MARELIRQFPIDRTRHLCSSGVRSGAVVCHDKWQLLYTQFHAMRGCPWPNARTDSLESDRRNAGRRQGGSCPRRPR